MAGFSFDTSGVVVLDHAQGEAPLLFRWSDFTPFEQGYAESLLRAGGRRLPTPDDPRRHFGFSHLAPETIAMIRQDCAAFNTVLEAEPADPIFGPENGRRFWRFRQHPAASRPEWYAALLMPFPPLVVYLDDGKVRLREPAR